MHEHSWYLLIYIKLVN